MSDCIFCKIVNKEIPSGIVYEDEKVLAFKDISPEAPFHVLVIPKEHIESILQINEDNSLIISHIFIVISKIVTDYGLTQKGFRVVTNTGVEGGQTVGHLHFHVLGGRNLAWPPG